MDENIPTLLSVRVELERAKSAIRDSLSDMRFAINALYRANDLAGFRDDTDLLMASGDAMSELSALETLVLKTFRRYSKAIE